MSVVFSQMPMICRTCFMENLTSVADNCPSCGSSQITSHPELLELELAHIDCDAFYANVEKRDDPALKNKPVLVGGKSRGVVMAACYVAREYGIRSAMPMYKALKACPHAIIVSPNMSKYRRIGHQIRELMNTTTPLVEPISIDEAFLDLTGTRRLHGSTAAATLARLAAEIYATVGLTVTVGLSHNKFLAKLASGLGKPEGFQIIGRKETLSFLAPQHISRIWGVGKVLQKRLERDGINRVGQLQVLGGSELIKRYGKIGAQLAGLSMGEDSRMVTPGTMRKSLSSETTFTENITDFINLKQILWKQAEKVASALKKKNIGGRTITLKLKTSDFVLITRSRTLDYPTQLADIIFSTARDLLDKEANGTAYRLLGVGLSSLEPDTVCDPIDLTETEARQRKMVENAIDDLRDRMGPNIIKKGRTLGL